MTSEAVAEFTQEQGLFELSMLNAERAQYEFDDVMVEGLNMGIPPEILTRLQELWEATKEIAGEIVAIGKIIVMEIINFLRANATIAVGVAIGAAVSSLLLIIPFIGPLLFPLAALLTITYGFGVGAAMQYGDVSGSPLTAAVALATKFFDLFIRVMKAVAEYWKNSK